jgi:hypothetical protein
MTPAGHTTAHRWTPAPAVQPLVVRQVDRRQMGSDDSVHPALQRLSIGPVADPAEREADRVAAEVSSAVSGTSVLFTPAPTHASTVLRRQAPPDPASVDPVEAVRKEEEKQSKENQAKGLEALFDDLAKVDPLKSMIEHGEKVVATPEGKVAVGGLIASVVAAFVLAKKELPITSKEFDLGKGFSVTPLWKGPANRPTEAGAEVAYKFPSGPSLILGGKGGTETTPQGSVGIGYKPEKGVFAGGDFKLTTTVDAGGGAGVAFSLTFDLEKVEKKRRGGPERPRPSGSSQVENAVDPSIRRSTVPGAGEGPAAVPASVRAVLAQPGTSLPDDVRAGMGAAFGADFSRVRIHSDRDAVVSATDVGALAYTVGHHVVLGPGRWPPTTPDSRHTLAHELAHVVQQGAAPPVAAGGRR